MTTTGGSANGNDYVDGASFSMTGAQIRTSPWAMRDLQHRSAPSAPSPAAGDGTGFDFLSGGTTHKGLKQCLSQFIQS